jgi:hypothetical protein
LRWWLGLATRRFDSWPGQRSVKLKPINSELLASC